MPPEARMKLTLDSAGFGSAVSGVIATLDKLKDKMEVVAKHARRIFIGASVSIGGFAKLAMTQEDAMRRLDAALIATGQSTGAYSKKLHEQASAIQDVTKYGDEELLRLMSMATTMGVQADQLDNVTKSAIGLSAALGVNLDQALRMVALAGEGDTTMLNRYIPALRGATDEAEKMRIVNELLATGWALAKDEAGTASGALKQMANTLGDLGETIGNAFLPSIQAAAEWIKSGVGPIMEWIAANQKLIAWVGGVTIAVSGLLAALPLVLAGVTAIGTALAALGAALAAIISPIGLVVTAMAGVVGYIAYTFMPSWDELLDKIISVAAFGQAVFQNFGDALRASILQITKTIVGFGLDIAHTFTQVIPAYLGWLSRNWVQAFVNMTEFLASVLSNAYKNFTQFFSNVWSWLKGEKVDWKWTSLTDGFQTVLTEDLPKVAKRELSQTEKWLGNEIEKSMSNVWEDAGKNYDAMRQWIKGEKEEVDAEQEGVAKDIESLGDAKKGIDKAASSNAFEDLVASFGRIANAAASAGPDPAQSTALNTAKIADRQERANSLAEEQNELLRRALEPSAGDGKVTFAVLS